MFNPAQLIEDGFLFFVKFFLVIFVVSLIYSIFIEARDKNKKELGEIVATPLLQELQEAQQKNDQAAYERLCNQAVMRGTEFSTRKNIRAYFSVFEKAGFMYPEHGRYSREYGECLLWVIIYQEWAARHPEEANV